MNRTAEAVSPAHPDKIADQVSDAILTEALKVDPAARVAVETLVGHGTCAVVGEVTMDKAPDHKWIEAIVLGTLLDLGVNMEGVNVTIDIAAQSKEISKGVDVGGAGDQGIMVGYACRENEESIPQELYLSRKILVALVDKYGMRDAKAQVTVNDDLKAVRVVVSAEKLEQGEIVEVLMEILNGAATDDCVISVNPNGRWEGGIGTDTGVTGRKIVQDAYGPRVQVGGGAFSGKDATKVDRSAAYMARKAALEMLHAFDNANPEFRAKEAKVTVAYAIGIAEPVSLTFEVDGKDAKLIPEVHAGYLKRFEPASMLKELELDRQDYRKVAAWGSFGTKELPWEKIA